MAAMANVLNSIAFRRCKLLMSKFTYVGNFPQPPQTFFSRFYCSPYVSDVYVIMLLGDNGPGGAGNYFWTVDGVNQSAHSVANSVASAGPEDYFFQASRFVTAGGASLAPGVHDVSCTLTSTTAISGCAILEIPKGIETTNALPPDVYSVGSPILDRDIAALTDRTWGIYLTQGTHQIHWTSNAVGATQTGTTYANILDGATTGYASTAAGFHTIPYRQSTLAGTTVPVTMWVYADDGAGAANTGRVRFVNAAGTIGTITGIGAAGYYTTTGTLDPTLTSDLVIIEHSNATAGQSCTTRGAGMYCLDT
jgi:hypothetical protein